MSVKNIILIVEKNLQDSKHRIFSAKYFLDCKIGDLGAAENS